MLDHTTTQPELFVDGASVAKARGGMVRLEVPSGGATIAFALTPNAALMLQEMLRRAVLNQHAEPSAGVIRFPAKAKGKRHG